MHDKKLSNPTSNVYVKISLITSNHNKSAASRTRERNHTKKKKTMWGSHENQRRILPTFYFVCTKLLIFWLEYAYISTL